MSDTISIQHLEERLHDLEEEFDTFVRTPWWRRLMFALLGWPWYRLVDHPQWRPWPLSVWQKAQWRKANG